MIIGYVRVSTQDQNLDSQIRAIEEYALRQKGELKIFEEKASGTRVNRSELSKALDPTVLREGDTFVVYRLDRLARSVKQLHEIAELLDERKVNFVSLQDNIDTKTATGKAMFGMIAVFAEFERNLIAERTKAGLESAKVQGKLGGRPALKESTKERVRQLYSRGVSASELAKEYNIGRSTVYKILNEEKGE